MQTWRLLDTPPMTAHENMALDDTLLELKGKGETPNTIRFLQFSPRAVLVGYHQSIEEEVRTGYCLSNGIHMNRRITGGGAIFFDENQLGWEVICEKAFFNVEVPNRTLFRKLCDPVVTALDVLGLRAAFRPRNDIEISGRKISGTGGTESEDAFLFQGTMLVDFDVETMLRSLRIPVEKLKAKEIDSIKDRVTCLKWELGYVPSLEDIKQAIRTGFEKHLGVALEPGGLTDSEKRLFERKVDYYASSEWIHLVRSRHAKQEVVQAAYKADGGMVRVSLLVDLAGKRIKDAYITGDFLSFPTRALFDMEAVLRGARLDRDHIHGILQGFFADRIRIPGMRCEDFLKPIDLALEKTAISRHGIPLDHCNLISVTNGSFDQVLRQKPSVLLLPYCSKDLSCNLRYEKECNACGKCSVGPACDLAKSRNMEVVCIVSFEDLMQELSNMKSAGVSAFIGCCCQPFFTKHVDDFERLGLPGIFLDIDDTTCYELDQAKEAYAGKFSSQTQVNLGLLEEVLNAMAA
ncbi:MAG: DUF116 domain-containing protein [Deltaproteobacteria bacterium]|nr:DUF116 domain-containing protein [Deltaproteobacteria bacterium]